MQDTTQHQEPGRIYAALAGVMGDATAIGKDSKNLQQGFMFRGIDAVMNHLHPIFAKHRVIVLPDVLEDRTEERQTKSGGNLIYRVLKIRFVFMAYDGSSVSSTVIGEGMDSGDKAANKAMAVALKYALTQMLLLPYDEVDPDAETHPASVHNPQAAQPVTNPTKPKKPMPKTKGTATGKITKLAAKETANGKTKYGIQLDDADWYGTFSSTVSDESAGLQGERVVIEYTQDEYGRHIDSITPEAVAATVADVAADTQRKGQKEQAQ